MELEAGVSSCRFLYVDWIRSKTLLCSTENYIQHAIIKHNGKVLKIIYIYNIYIYITESLCYLPVNKSNIVKRLYFN